MISKPLKASLNKISKEELKKEKEKILHGKEILERDFEFFKKLESYEEIIDNFPYQDLLQFRKYRFNTYLNEARRVGFELAWNQLNDFRDLTHRERQKKRDELLKELRVK